MRFFGWYRWSWANNLPLWLLGYQCFLNISGAERGSRAHLPLDLNRILSFAILSTHCNANFIIDLISKFLSRTWNFNDFIVSVSFRFLWHIGSRPNNNRCLFYFITLLIWALPMLRFFLICLLQISRCLMTNQWLPRIRIVCLLLILQIRLTWFELFYMLLILWLICRSQRLIHLYRHIAIPTLSRCLHIGRLDSGLHWLLNRYLNLWGALTCTCLFLLLHRCFTDCYSRLNDACPFCRVPFLGDCAVIFSFFVNFINCFWITLFHV